jgi:hypothetical protein
MNDFESGVEVVGCSPGCKMRKGASTRALLLAGVAAMLSAVPCAAATNPAALAPNSGDAWMNRAAVGDVQANLLASAAAPERFAATASGAVSLRVPEDAAATFSGSAEGLPDAPSALAEGGGQQSQAMPPPRATHGPMVGQYTKYVPSGMSAPPLSQHDKFYLGLRDLYSPLNFIAMAASAGYSHLTNGEPNYGTDKGAFGERLGAAAIRESTQGFFTDSVFSPLLHEDPRYYIEGSQYNFFHRVVYAATRPLLSRTDSGRSTINGALLLGYASSAALSYTYYPKINQNFHDTAATFGSSLGGAALGYVVSEFSDDVLRALHMHRKQ